MNAVRSSDMLDTRRLKSWEEGKAKDFARANTENFSFTYTYFRGIQASWLPSFIASWPEGCRLFRTMRR